MDTNRLVKGILALAVMLVSTAAVQAAQVTFDLPSSIECREVTLGEFSQAHADLKVVEARFRISAKIDGPTDDLVEFFYVIKTDPSMRINDYMPNTTLESTVDNDHIEVTDASERAKATGANGHVALNPFGLGGSHTASSKKSESSHYKQIAAKDLVLSSGTIDREHGVFFRLRPSRTDSLEGGKEFRFRAVVPKTWRGGLCTISCEARATKRTVISTTVVPSGADEVQIGLYAAGDPQASALAEDLRVCQDARAKLLAEQARVSVVQAISTQTVGLLTGKAAQQRRELDNAEKALAEVREQLEQLAK